jgi:hypothetical protein
MLLLLATASALVRRRVRDADEEREEQHPPISGEHH